MPALIRTLGLVAGVTLAAGVIAPGSAGAATPPVITAQAQEANAAFLGYAPAPPTGAGSLCIVDTGVGTNADTTAGLIASYAVDNGPPGDADPAGHGTNEAMIAGGAGHGLRGAWPQLKIVSVRETTNPGAGHEPTFQFENYAEGLTYCQQNAVQDHIKAVLLALNSTIPGTPDQTQAFAAAVQGLEQQDNIAVVASAGNDNGGPVEEPASEPGVFGVDAGTAYPNSGSETKVGSPCAFSATQGVMFYAPGCGLDEANPITDQPFCCGNGTSQAAAFTAATIVALMSYNPNLSYQQAEATLVQTASQGGNLDVAAAFKAVGLESIITTGTATIPKPTGHHTTGKHHPAGHGRKTEGKGKPHRSAKQGHHRHHADRGHHRHATNSSDVIGKEIAEVI